MDDLRQLLATLSDSPGISGYEGETARLLSHELKQLVDEVTTDVMGNVIGVRSGKGPRVMLAAHMDEIGLMVKHIDDKGFLRFVPIGGWFDQMLLGQRVIVRGTSGPLPGVIGSKPPHIMDEEDRKKPVRIKDMFIDIGATNADDAHNLGVEVGTPVTMDRRMVTLANDLVTGKSFDDRAGVVMMLMALRMLQDRDVNATVLAVGTVQEEVGLKGARTCAYGLDPDLVIVCETNIPGDHPGVTKEQRGLELGKGPVITVADADGRGVLVPQKVLQWLRAAGDAAGVPYQLDVGSGGTTDATAIHLTKAGIPTGVVSVATRYIHSPIEVLSLSDLEQGARLIAEAVATAHTVG